MRVCPFCRSVYLRISEADELEESAILEREEESFGSALGELEHPRPTVGMHSAQEIGRSGRPPIGVVSLGGAISKNRTDGELDWQINLQLVGNILSSVFMAS